jgi:hypothetical protein
VLLVATALFVSPLGYILVGALAQVSLNAARALF